MWSSKCPQCTCPGSSVMVQARGAGAQDTDAQARARRHPPGAARCLHDLVQSGCGSSYIAAGVWTVLKFLEHSYLHLEHGLLVIPALQLDGLITRFSYMHTPTSSPTHAHVRARARTHTHTHTHTQPHARAGRAGRECCCSFQQHPRANAAYAREYHWVLRGDVDAIVDLTERALSDFLAQLPPALQRCALPHHPRRAPQKSSAEVTEESSQSQIQG